MKRHGYVAWQPVYLNFYKQRRHGQIILIPDEDEKMDECCSVCAEARSHPNHGMGR